jgi:twitching motility two-component system response regulator PilH
MWSATMAFKKVLCVDDVNADLINIEKIVSAEGHLVSTAVNGKDAVAKARAEKPSIIFLDVNMPEMDGFAAMRELKKDADTKSIPIVLVTSKNQKADKLWAQMQGANGFVSKPYTPEQILEHLRSL